MLSRNLSFRACLASGKPHKYVIGAGDLFLTMSASPLFSRVSNIEINSIKCGFKIVIECCTGLTGYVKIESKPIFNVKIVG